MTVDRSALLHALRELYAERDAYLGARFDRSLPMADALLENRWVRAERLGFGCGSSIYDSALVLGLVEVGTDTWVGPGVILDGSGGNLTIGSNCSISAGCHLYTHDTVLWALSGGAARRREGSISIGDCCYIGAQSTVAPGVRVGRQCVIAANSFVNKSVPERTIVGGTPARILGRVEGDGADVRLVFDHRNRGQEPSASLPDPQPGEEGANR